MEQKKMEQPIPRIKSGWKQTKAELMKLSAQKAEDSFTGTYVEHTIQIDTTDYTRQLGGHTDVFDRKKETGRTYKLTSEKPGKISFVCFRRKVRQVCAFFKSRENPKVKRLKQLRST